MLIYSESRATYFLGLCVGAALFVVLSIVSFSVFVLLLCLYCTGDFSPQTYRILPHSDQLCGCGVPVRAWSTSPGPVAYSSGRTVAR